MSTTLWILKDAGAEWEIDHPATVPEVVAWLREQRAIDYEAGTRARYERHRDQLVAAAEKNDKLMILPEWDELPEDERKHRISESQIVVDAALGGGR